LPNKSYVDFVVDEDQEFTVETDTVDMIKNLKFEGSEINQNFLDYQLFMMDMNETAVSLRDKIKNLEESDGDHSAEIEKFKEELKELNPKVQNYWNDVIEKYPETLFGKLIKMMKDIEIPDPPKDENGNITDSLFQYKYYKAHYFDNIDFTDSAVLRTPLFHQKLENYFTRVIIQNPDTINKEADVVIAIADTNEEFFQYTLQFIFNHFTQSNIMGMDKVFVHLAENYYINGRAHWADTAFLRKIGERVIKIKPNLIGQKAIDLKMVTMDGSWASLYSVDAKYTILYFWDPDCGHCKKVTPKLHDLYEKLFDKGVEVFSVYTQVNKEEWEEYINENAYTDWLNVYDPYNFTGFRKHYDIYSTPVAYLLNDKKEIIAKRVDVEVLEEILYDKLGLEKPEKKEENKEETE
jgi:thiol-disulfide isomerase/thioredoxin